MGFFGRFFGGGMGRVNFMVEHSAGKDVLDLGVVQHDAKNYALDNWLHRHIRDAAKSCVGIDNDRDGIDYLQAQRLDVQYGDAQNLDLGRTFDVITAGDIIEHLDDTAGFFGSVRRHLRPDGTLVIATANPWFWVRIGQALILGRVNENVQHTCWYTPQTLTELLDRHGFDVEHVEYGSSEEWVYRLKFLRPVVRHAGFFMVARPRLA